MNACASAPAPYNRAGLSPPRRSAYHPRRRPIPVVRKPLRRGRRAELQHIGRPSHPARRLRGRRQGSIPTPVRVAVRPAVRCRHPHHPAIGLGLGRGARRVPAGLAERLPLRCHAWQCGRAGCSAWCVTARSTSPAAARAEDTGAAVPDIADEDPDPLARLVTTSEGAALHRCLEKLPQDRRSLISLAFVEGLTHSELADRLKLPLGTVKSWIRRGLASLRDCLEA